MKTYFFSFPFFVEYDSIKIQVESKSKMTPTNSNERIENSSWNRLSFKEKFCESCCLVLNYFKRSESFYLYTQVNYATFN